MEYKLNQKVIDNRNRVFLAKTGMSYDEFTKLDFDEQQQIIKEIHKNDKVKNLVPVMIGYGEHATFIKMKKDKKYKTVDGVIVSAVTTLEKEQKKFKTKEKRYMSK